ncbi:MAG: hypothetical protein BJ554DRAFT_2865 [Olpidium bornovanus]|uniref:Uncharacterized protein n=1 Tax=Olpidium bornovanus TaxID=278681 RepID=A0A8H8A1F6_9FUNG|nr:MAG: hypothetical protein BJ554DRAFT_2865 [Olpidium bornovanus]
MPPTFVLPLLQPPKTPDRAGGMSAAFVNTTPQQQQELAPSLCLLGPPPALPSGPPAPPSLRRATGASSGHAAGISATDSLPPTTIPKDLLQGVRILQDNSRIARCRERDSAVRAVFSRGQRSVSEAPVGDDTATSGSPQMAGTAASGTCRDESKLLRAKEIARTKIRINATRLFNTIFHSAELNAYLDRAMKYIGCFLRHLEVEEWKHKRMGETKFPGCVGQLQSRRCSGKSQVTKVFEAANSASNSQEEKETAMKELGMRYSLLLVRVAKERNTVVERACFEVAIFLFRCGLLMDERENGRRLISYIRYSVFQTEIKAIYKLTNVVARIYFPVKSKWDAIGDELDILFRGEHFHRRPDNFDPGDTWKSKAGPPLRKLSEFQSIAACKAASTSSTKVGSPGDPLVRPAAARLAISALSGGSEERSRLKGAKEGDEGTEGAKREDYTKRLDEMERPGLGRSRRRSQSKSAIDEDVTQPNQRQQLGEGCPERGGSRRASALHQHQGVHVHIYKSLRSRSQFTEQILPSASEAARALSFQEKKKILDAHHHSQVTRQSRSTSPRRGGVFRGWPPQSHTSYSP